MSQMYLAWTAIDPAFHRTTSSRIVLRCPKGHRVVADDVREYPVCPVCEHSHIEPRVVYNYPCKNCRTWLEDHAGSGAARQRPCLFAPTFFEPFDHDELLFGDAA